MRGGHFLKKGAPLLNHIEPTPIRKRPFSKQGTSSKMLKTEIEYYKEQIRGWLRAAGHYTSALEGNIFVLAGTMARYAKALNETAEMDFVSFKSPNGALQQHPAYKMQRECEESILKQLKELRLTSEGTRSTVERDPAVELIQDVFGSRRPRIVKPDNE